MIPAVADFAQREGQGGGAAAQGAAGQAAAASRPTGFTDKVLLTPEELRQKLK